MWMYVFLHGGHGEDLCLNIFGGREEISWCKYVFLHGGQGGNTHGGHGEKSMFKLLGEEKNIKLVDVNVFFYTEDTEIMHTEGTERTCV